MYTKEISFVEEDDVRIIMDHLQIERQETQRSLSESSKVLGAAEWEYRRLLRLGEESEDLEEMDVRTVISTSSINTRRSGISPSPSSGGRAFDARSTSSSRTGVSKATSASTPSTTKTGRISQTSTSPRTRPVKPASTVTPAAIDKGPPTPLIKPSKTSPAAISRPSYIPRAPDPHAHPCSTPAPASALSVFMLSHRYGMEKLETLAKAHILDQLTPDNCMPML